ncbi:MAG: protein-glutamate O-methyltransferase CheR [Clostridiales bacterium]|nr:protein-glutamate O-methyltransferase CheR [Clostridiales bacterium]
MFKERHFKSYSGLLYDKTGISISPSKREMFHMKIQKLMRRHSVECYDEYFDLITNINDTKHVQDFINTITTNTTEFFRENAHFEYLKDNIEEFLKSNPRIMQNNEIRLWCAASSSGQEPATIAMVLKECLDPRISIKILATDISSKVLKIAMKGSYTDGECEGISKYYLMKYFKKTHNGYQLKHTILKSISYRYFNLMQDFNFKSNFDIIFCRNVMIYFDRDVQETLINKFYENIVNEGLLFIGHSESLINKMHSYKYLGPSIYKKLI